MDLWSGLFQYYLSSCLSLVNIGLCDWKHVGQGALGRARGPVSRGSPSSQQPDVMECLLVAPRYPPFQGLAEVFRRLLSAPLSESGWINEVSLSLLDPSQVSYLLRLPLVLRDGLGICWGNGRPLTPRSEWLSLSIFLGQHRPIRPFLRLSCPSNLADGSLCCRSLANPCSQEPGDCRGLKVMERGERLVDKVGFSSAFLTSICFLPTIPLCAPRLLGMERNRDSM